MAKYTSDIKPSTKGMTTNAAGFEVFEIDKWTQLRRFLVIGTQGGTYYASQKDLTKQNAGIIAECITADPKRTVDTIIEVSDQGLAPKNDPAIFALAMCLSSSNREAKHYAMLNVNKVCRIGTHVLMLASMLKELRGGGRIFRQALSSWYLNQKPDNLAYQIIKYQSREKWSHADILNLCHAKPSTPEHESIFKYIVKNRELSEETPNIPKIVVGAEEAKGAKTTQEIIAIIQEYNIPWEAIPTQWHNEKEVWECLLPNMGMTAVIRNLRRFREMGFVNSTQERDFILSRLTSEEQLKKARIHPFNLYTAKLAYANQDVFGDALEEAFYMAFKTVEPINCNFVLGIDVSGSMASWGFGSYTYRTPLYSPRDVAAVMAMTTIRTEPYCLPLAFSNQLIVLDLKPTDKLETVKQKMSNLPFSYTDPSLVFKYIVDNRIQADAIVVYTDNEVNNGMTVTQMNRLVGDRLPLLRKIGVGVTATNGSLFDDKDPYSFNLCGFDSSAPSLISDFVAGKV